MWRNKLIAILILASSTAFGQVGNEWIDLTQSYYKLKIAEDGFYRVTRAELQAIGFPITSVNPNRIQLFRRGEEVALNVVSETDDFVDYFEFYGERNDGSGDAALYDAGNQPHTFYNLFSDTASYLLTYKLGGGENGKRMTFSSDQSTSGLSPEPYHIQDTIQLFTSSYAPGAKFGSGSAFSLSEYDSGEGWTGGFQSKNSFKDFNFNLSDYESSGNNPILETVLIGGNRLDHNVEIRVGPNNSSLRVLGNVPNDGWDHQF